MQPGHPTRVLRERVDEGRKEKPVAYQSLPWLPIANQPTFPIYFVSGLL
jgi:hypothetical protein